jgi:HEAT repeat protein
MRHSKRFQILIRLLGSACLLSSSACVVLVPFIESDMPEGAAGEYSSYAYKEGCSTAKDPIVHFFGPQPVGALSEVKRELVSPGKPQRSYPRVNKRESLINRLIKQLGNGEEVVRTHAASDLGMMGSAARRAVPELSMTLQHDSSKWVRRAAARALGRIGAREGIPALERAIRSDSNKYVSHSAERSLRRIRLTGV